MNKAINTTASVMPTSLSLLAIAAAITLAVSPSSAKDNSNKTEHYVQINLVSDQPDVAQLQDTNLVNAWGISFSSGSPFWVSGNGTGLALLYAVTNDSSGAAHVAKQPLQVTIPGEGNPTGQLFNNLGGFNGDIFIFA